jgi:hypothetical protein
MDLIYQDLETSIHDLVDFFRIEFLGNGRVVGHVREEHRDKLSFTFDGTAGCEDLVGQVSGGVGLRLGEVDWKGFFGLC